VAGRRRHKRPCPYCGQPTEGAACPLHRELVRLDPLGETARRPLTEAELGLPESELEEAERSLPAPPRSGRMRRRSNLEEGDQRGCDL
jgi:hypothetical protein